MKNMRSLLSSLLLVACIICGTSSALAQGSNLGTIRGAVTDPHGGVLPNTPVQVTDLETNTTRDLTTNGEGQYEASNLKPGEYVVRVSAQGFKPAEVRNVMVRGSDVARADVRLEVGAASESVTVTEAASITTDTPQLATTLENRQILDMPRDTRDYQNYLFQSPSITQGEGGVFKYVGAQSYGAAFSLDGQRSNGGIFGEPTASQPSLESIGELTVLSNNFTAEYAGIANVRVSTKRGGKQYNGSLFYNNKNSEFAALRLSDKAALASFIPDANNPSFPLPHFNLNEVGGSFSGPVPGSDRTFFMLAYERRWDLGSATFTGANTIPGQRILNGDFSQLPDASKPAVPANVLAAMTQAEIDANTKLVGSTRRFVTIPQRIINPVANALVQSYFPHTSVNSLVDSRGRLLNFAQNVNGLITRDLGTLRLDHNFSDRQLFYAVYNASLQQGSQSPAAAGGAGEFFVGYPEFGLRDRSRRNNTVSLSHTSIFSSTAINEVRGGFNFQKQFDNAPRTVNQILTGAGFTSADIAAYEAVVGTGVTGLYGQPTVTLVGYTGVSNGGRSAQRNLNQDLVTLGDTFSLIRGRHSMKFGADMVRNHAVDSFVVNRGQVRGQIQYRSTNNSENIMRLLLGLPADRVNFVQNRRGDLDVVNYETGYFAQDDFKVTPNLTLNLGLRYELITPFVDKNDLMINFDPAGTNPTGKKGVFVVPSQQTIPQVDPRITSYGVITADQAGVGRGLVDADKNNFAPRLGAAYRFNDRTALRGGYGVFFPTAAAQGIRDALESAPFNQGREKRPSGPAPLAGFPGGLFGIPAGNVGNHGFSPLTGGAIRAIGSQPSVNVIPRDLQNPRVEQFNLTLERELGRNTGLRVSYLGTRMHGLISGVDLNMVAPSDTGFGTTQGNNTTPCSIADGTCELSAADLARRPFPELGAFLASYGNVGRGNSNAFQAELNRRFTNGLSFNASYTLLDQKTTVIDTGNSSLGGQTYNQFALDQELSRDSFVSRHRFVGFVIYDLPYGRGRQYGKDSSRALDAVLGGWQLSTNFMAKSGYGFTPFWACDNCGDQGPGNTGSDFVDATGGFFGSSFRARLVGDPYATTGGDRFLNAAAFALPTTGADVFSNAIKANSITGPGAWSANLGLSKNFRFTERVRLKFGATFNNVFNHPLLSPNTINGPEFARLGSFSVEVDPATRGVLIPASTVTPNGDFGRVNRSYTQEGYDSRRTLRWQLRLTF